MTWVLVRKILRDIRLPLLVVAILLFCFQLFWAKVTDRVLGELAPFFNGLAQMAKKGGEARKFLDVMRKNNPDFLKQADLLRKLGVPIPEDFDASVADLSQEDIESVVFNGPGKIVRTVIGGDAVDTKRAMDMLSIGWVHPLVQTILCIWAVGRSSGAIAGEIDRGTMELLLSQPLGRVKVLLAHLVVDLLTIPVLCLSVWAGTCTGSWIIDPIEIRYPQGEKFEWLRKQTEAPEQQAQMRRDLEIRPLEFGPAVVVMAGLVFAVSGFTMVLSACGRFRWRVLGLAVLLVLLQFLMNLIGQMWDVTAPLRPFTIFYYYQPQKVILAGQWSVDFSVWNNGNPTAGVPMLLVLFGIGAAGYLLALLIFGRRDVPAPL